jgi:hypothetical protein
MSGIKDNLRNAGQKVAEKAEQAKEWVEDKTGLGCGSDKGMAIAPHMHVMSSCGCKVGEVDHLEGGAIKLTKGDSPDGRHHFVPLAWVDHVDNHVHLRKNAEETKREWKADAASCTSCGA